MIRNRLSILIAERNLKISRVAKDTGVSRSTVTSIAQNDSKMIQMDTIDILCRYLEVTPAEFFDYNPLHFEVSVFTNQFKLEDAFIYFRIKTFNFEIFIDVENADTKQTISMTGKLLSEYVFDEEDNKPIILSLDFDDKEEEILFRNFMFGRLTKPFQLQFIEQFDMMLTKELFKNYSDKLLILEKEIPKHVDLPYLRSLNEESFEIKYDSVFTPVNPTMWGDK